MLWLKTARDRGSRSRWLTINDVYCETRTSAPIACVPAEEKSSKSRRDRDRQLFYHAGSRHQLRLWTTVTSRGSRSASCRRSSSCQGVASCSAKEESRIDARVYEFPEREVHVGVKRGKVGSDSGRHSAGGDHTDELRRQRDVEKCQLYRPHRASDNGTQDLAGERRATSTLHARRLRAAQANLPVEDHRRKLR